MPAPRRWHQALSRRLAHQPVLSVRSAALLVAVYFTFLGNLSFWSNVFRAASHERLPPWLPAVILAIVLVVNLILATLVSFPRVLKPVAVLLVLFSVMVDHFIRTYGVVIDSTMIQNVTETDRWEVWDLATWRLLLHMVIFGVVPLALLLWAEVRYRRPLAELASRLAVVLGCLALLGLLTLGSYRQLVTFARNHRTLRHQVTPFNYLVAIHRLAMQRVGVPRTVAAWGKDARLSSAALASERKKLIVLVIGETARSMNLSLNGYSRVTNPHLAGEDVLSYTQVRACATDTSTSLRCMFSGSPRSEYDDRVGKHRENLLDLLQHAGVRVLWRENNTGCKNVCDRVPTEVLTRGDSLDAVLLEGLDSRLSHVDADMLIVLHQRGSHGPAYYRRYPSAFERFVPTCDTNDLGACTREAVVNTYDNTLLYTDFILAETIRLLRRHSASHDVGLIYVSDHGESLGENNLYLHSLPYWIAPEEQKRVPFVLWLSPPLLARSELDAACLAGQRDEPLSHDHLFHSILGLMEVETGVYDPALDLFSRCRGRR
jgi:lipid A ethanolaminephosphotransferase